MIAIPDHDMWCTSEEAGALSTMGAKSAGSAVMNRNVTPAIADTLLNAGDRHAHAFTDQPIRCEF